MSEYVQAVAALIFANASIETDIGLRFVYLSYVCIFVTF